MSELPDIRNNQNIRTASDKLDIWIEHEDFQGWDPFDALNSPMLKRLTFGNRSLGQVWLQLFKRSPVNFRPVLKIKKGYNPKGIGLFVATYWRKYLLTGQKEDLDRVVRFVNWLSEHRSPGYGRACWGYNFDWPNRGSYTHAGMPTLVNSAFIGLACSDLLTLPVSHNTHSELETQALEISRGACEFILHDLKCVQPEPNKMCFSYTPFELRYIHNANALGAWLLAKVSVITADPELRRVALDCARYTARRQRSDGSWLYGEEPRERWVDNFHTGYILMSLHEIQWLLETHEFDEFIQKGYEYWKNNFILVDGTPKYYPNKIHPIDIHSAAQSILTFLVFSDLDSEANSNAQLVAEWAIQNMQDPEGFFYYQINRFYSIHIPYMRWSQAWIQRALTEIAWVTEHDNLG
jgi:hypothetical protein